MLRVLSAQSAKQRASVLRLRLWLSLVATLCAAAIVCKYHQYEPETKPRLPLAQRAFAMCQAMNRSCENVSAPRLYDETVPLPGVAQATRRLWGVTCQTNGRHVMLLFNDKTNRLCCVFGETRIGPVENGARINSSEAALDIALLRLRQMQMIASDAEYALEAPPTLVREDNAWQIEWKVKHPGDATPRRLKFVMDRDGGFPLHVTDQYELQQFASK